MRKLSIVTITYQDPAGLKRTFDSLRPLHETKKFSFEHVVVDSSPEQSKKILSELPSDWPLIHVVTPAEGVYAAMNAGIEKSQGEVLWFLNGGDRLKSSESLIHCLGRFESNPQPDLVIGSADLFRDGRFRRNHRPFFTHLFWNLLGENRICHQEVLYRRSVFERIGAFDLRFKYAADYEHLMRCALKQVVVRFQPEVIVEYDLGGRSDAADAVLEEFAAVQDLHLKKFPLALRGANHLLRKIGSARVLVANKVREKSV